MPLLQLPLGSLKRYCSQQEEILYWYLNFMYYTVFFQLTQQAMKAEDLGDGDIDVASLN